MGAADETPGNGVRTVLGGYDGVVRGAIGRLQKDRVVERLWEKDASLWKGEEETRTKIRHRLGWLDVVSQMKGRVQEVQGFVRSLTDGGVRHVVLLGMGGSSLCPEVCIRTFGAAPGYPDLMVLDSTDPATIREIEGAVDLQKSVFIVASKSGSTIEVNCLYRYFFERVRAGRPDSPGAHFVAITDPGTPLEALAMEKGFRRIFSAPPDVGGRYSALTPFGLVPAALIGIDLNAYLGRAEAMADRCGPGITGANNPGLFLGAVLGALGAAGRDKVTFFTSKPLKSFGLWAEQLLAESTGKGGVGLVPVATEYPGEESRYGNDRLFIDLRLEGHTDAKQDHLIDSLRQSGHPLVQISLSDRLSLAAEFYRWEFATAVAGVVLGINPFDEPNVTESKENTARVLQGYRKTGRLAEQSQLIQEEDISIFGESARPGAQGLKEVFWDFLSGATPPRYVAIMAYLQDRPEHEGLLQRLRTAVRDRFKAATTLGYGPRFLHSTGQLHKGGPPTGLFVQITADAPEDLPIPGESFGFGTLKGAQALGDYQSLARRDLPLMRVHLGKDIAGGLKRLLRHLEIGQGGMHAD